MFVGDWVCGAVLMVEEDEPSDAEMLETTVVTNDKSTGTYR